MANESCGRVLYCTVWQSSVTARVAARVRSHIDLFLLLERGVDAIGGLVSAGRVEALTGLAPVVALQTLESEARDARTHTQEDEEDKNEQEYEDGSDEHHFAAD